jgi:hypothetical protein
MSQRNYHHSHSHNHNHSHSHSHSHSHGHSHGHNEKHHQQPHAPTVAPSNRSLVPCTKASTASKVGCSGDTAPPGAATPGNATPALKNSSTRPQLNTAVVHHCAETQDGHHPETIPLGVGMNEQRQGTWPRTWQTARIGRLQRRAARQHTTRHPSHSTHCSAGMMHVHNAAADATLVQNARSFTRTHAHTQTRTYIEAVAVRPCATDGRVPGAEEVDLGQEGWILLVLLPKDGDWLDVPQQWLTGGDGQLREVQSQRQCQEGVRCIRAPPMPMPHTHMHTHTRPSPPTPQ